MPRPATGQVVRRKSGVWALRFRACGARQYQTLGTAEEGWTRQKAEQALRHVMADVERGVWRPAQSEPAPEANLNPSFHEFASEWFEATKGEWQENTQLDYEWQLANHLLPFFRDHRLGQITTREIDRYRQAKVAEAQTIRAAAAEGKPLTDEYVDKRGRRHRRPRRALSAASINKTITRLGQILEVAVEYGLIEANPAKGRRRRLKAQKAIPVWLDRAEHIEALLDAAGELDRHATVKGGHDQKGGPAYRRALLATLVFAGLRIGELTALQWRDVDLTGNRITVRMSKTDAGVRQIDLLPALRDELDAYKAQAPSTAPSGYVFATTSGTEPKQGNIRRRVLDKAVGRANEKLSEAGDIPLPDGLTPHKLRHTFASILVALASIRAVSWTSSGTPIPALPCGSTATGCAATMWPGSGCGRLSKAPIGKQRAATRRTDTAPLPSVVLGLSQASESGATTAAGHHPVPLKSTGDGRHDKRRTDGQGPSLL